MTEKVKEEDLEFVSGGTENHSAHVSVTYSNGTINIASNEKVNFAIVRNGLGKIRSNAVRVTFDDGHTAKVSMNVPNGFFISVDIEFADGTSLKIEKQV